VTRQLIFDLPGHEALTRADFFVSPSNALALRTLDAWADWPGAKLILIGPAGAGKTHLAQIWAAEAGATIVHARDLGRTNLAPLSDQRIAVEDADQIGPDEEALFHLHNLVAARGALLLTAASPPRDWGLTLADLASRMQAAPTVRLDAPDDALLSAVLIKLFADRQIAVPANLIPYLVSRMPRSIGAARGLVGALDARALALGRPITRQLAADVLDSGDGQ
jgi:chromosomal replication initiation ATPase DnaA